MLKLTAMGVKGGCNTGVLNAWGGTVRLDSQARRPEPDSTYDDLPPCLPWIIAPQCQLR